MEEILDINPIQDPDVSFSSQSPKKTKKVKKETYQFLEPFQSLKKLKSIISPQKAAKK